MVGVFCSAVDSNHTAITATAVHHQDGRRRTAQRRWKAARGEEAGDGHRKHSSFV
jgi:hypothetical protein